MRWLLPLAAATAALLAVPATGANLPRKAALAVRLGPAPQGTSGALAVEVFPGGTASAIGLRNGDLVVSAGGRPVTRSADLVAYASSLHAGEKVEITVRRDGRDVRLGGKAKPRPLEAYADATVDYGAVPFRGGLIRDILVSPKAVANPPVLFLLQGFSCASIDSGPPEDSYRRLGEELLKRGVAYYRVEKPGLGDSSGTPACADIDFTAELEAFRAAYKHLIEDRHVDPDRIFMFGHSLGGLEAPLLAAETPPRGVAAYGTVLRNWADYHLDIDRYQTFLANGTDPGEAAAATERDRELFRRFYFGKEAPAQLAAGNPAYGAAMREVMGWDGTDRLFGRNYRFMQELAGLPLASAWRRAKTNVLALYGESDIVAIDDRDHKMIADIADFYRPGSGRFVEVAKTGHGMTLVGNRHEYREKAMAAEGAPPDGPFNPQVAEILAGWIKDSMERPPVRLQAERQVPAPQS
ncbi:MAG TPA: alpha/beta fold hydrolase [Sphingomicrobium sp.]